MSYKRVKEQCLTRVSSKKCQVREPSKGVAELVSSKSVLRECFTRVSSKTVLQECQVRVSYKSVKQECPTKVSNKSVKQVSYQSVSQ